MSHSLVTGRKGGQSPAVVSDAEREVAEAVSQVEKVLVVSTHRGRLSERRRGVLASVCCVVCCRLYRSH